MKIRGRLHWTIHLWRYANQALLWMHMDEKWICPTSFTMPPTLNLSWTCEMVNGIQFMCTYTKELYYRCVRIRIVQGRLVEVFNVELIFSPLCGVWNIHVHMYTCTPMFTVDLWHSRSELTEKFWWQSAIQCMWNIPCKGKCKLGFIWLNMPEILNFRVRISASLSYWVILECMKFYMRNWKCLSMALHKQGLIFSLYCWKMK
jgi:hypothetical protein